MQEEPKKQCLKCHQWLSYRDFYVNRATKDGLCYWCKDCKKDYNKKLQTLPKVRLYQMSYKYNITPAQYERMLTEQNGVCAICKMPESHIHGRTGAIQPLSVDHDHRTGDVRALLCNACNTALGFMNEDPERIRALLHYAEWCQTREPDIKIIQPTLLDLAG